MIWQHESLIFRGRRHSSDNSSYTTCILSKQVSNSKRNIIFGKTITAYVRKKEIWQARRRNDSQYNLMHEYVLHKIPEHTVMTQKDYPLSFFLPLLAHNRNNELFASIGWRDEQMYAHIKLQVETVAVGRSICFYSFPSFQISAQ